MFTIDDPLLRDEEVAGSNPVTPMNNPVHQGRVVHWGETNAPASGLMTRSGTLTGFHEVQSSHPDCGFAAIEQWSIRTAEQLKEDAEPAPPRSPDHLADCSRWTIANCPGVLVTITGRPLSPAQATPGWGTHAVCNPMGLKVQCLKAGDGRRPAGMIGTSFAFSIERGDIPAMQNSAEHGPRPMHNGIPFNQLLA